MANKKHYIITSITLGAVALSSAGLIGLTNFITKDKIVENESNKIKSSITAIFGSNSTIKKESSLDSYDYAKNIYIINDKNNTVGKAIKTIGSNMYGEISLIVGFKQTDNSFISMSIITNEQSYATTLVDNYINPINDGTRKIEDVSCGATYGAKLVRDMISDAQKACKEYKGE